MKRTALNVLTALFSISAFAQAPQVDYSALSEAQRFQLQTACSIEDLQEMQRYSYVETESASWYENYNEILAFAEEEGPAALARAEAQLQANIDSMAADAYFYVTRVEYDPEGQVVYGGNGYMFLPTFVVKGVKRSDAELSARDVHVIVHQGRCIQNFDGSLRENGEYIAVTPEIAGPLFDDERQGGGKDEEGHAFDGTEDDEVVGY